MSLNRTRIAALAAEAATWSPDKIEKAHRLFDATMACIAEALDVPVSALLAKVGVRLVRPAVPATEPEAQPRNEGQAAVDADVEEQEQIELGNAEAPVVPELSEVAPADPSNLQEIQFAEPEAAEGDEAGPAAPEPVSPEPGRDEDEAELAALAAAEAAEEPGTGLVAVETAEAEPVPLFRMVSPSGEYLDRSGVGLTRAMRKAWQGTAQQTEQIYRRRPEYRNLDVERVHA